MSFADRPKNKPRQYTDNPREHAGANQPPEPEQLAELEQKAREIDESLAEKPVEAPAPEPEPVVAPGPIDVARTAYKELQDFLANTPVIEDEETARLANEKLALARTSLKTVETARDEEATPLRKIWEDARAKYAPAIKFLSGAMDQATERLRVYMIAEKRKREAEAKRIADEAAKAKRLAEEAERKEREAIENAKQGEFVDTVAATAQADVAFDDFARKQREADRAEKDTNVKFKSRFDTKAKSLRTQKVIYVDDAAKALAQIGLTEPLAEAIKTAARAYKKQHGVYPDGIREENEEVL